MLKILMIEIELTVVDRLLTIPAFERRETF